MTAERAKAVRELAMRPQGVTKPEAATAMCLGVDYVADRWQHVAKAAGCQHVVTGRGTWHYFATEDLARAFSEARQHEIAREHTRPAAAPVSPPPAGASLSARL